MINLERVELRAHLYISAGDSSVIFQSDMLFHNVVSEDTRGLNTGQADRLTQVRVRLIKSVWQVLQPVKLHHASNTESLIGGKD